MVWVTARGSLQGLVTKPRRNELQGGGFDPEAELANTPGGMTRPPLQHREPSTEKPRPSLPRDMLTWGAERAGWW